MLVQCGFSNPVRGDKGYPHCQPVENLKNLIAADERRRRNALDFCELISPRGAGNCVLKVDLILLSFYPRRLCFASLTHNCSFRV